MKFIVVLAVVLLSACANQRGSSGVNPEQCKALQQRCQFGVYDEWIKDNGEVSCACHEKHTNPEPDFKRNFN